MATDAHHDGSSAAVWRTSSRTRGGRGRIAQLDSALRGSVDAGLAALVFAVPLILGGRTALGQLVLVGLTLWVAVCWCLRGCLASRSTWIRSGAEPKRHGRLRCFNSPAIYKEYLATVPMLNK